MASAAAMAPNTGDPLSPAHYHELTLAQSRASPIRKAAGVATFNGWTTGVIAALSAPFALFSVTGFLMTAGLSIVACNEFRGRKRLLNFDPAAASLLGWNQLGLLTMLVAYCLWMIWTGLTGPSPLAAELRANPELGEALGSVGDFDELFKRVAAAFYGSVIALTVIFQGLNSAYYFSRRKYVDAYLRDTPDWARALQRTEFG